MKSKIILIISIIFISILMSSCHLFLRTHANDPKIGVVYLKNAWLIIMEFPYNRETTPFFIKNHYVDPSTSEYFIELASDNISEYVDSKPCPGIAELKVQRTGQSTIMIRITLEDNIQLSLIDLETPSMVFFVKFIDSISQTETPQHFQASPSPTYDLLGVVTATPTANENLLAMPSITGDVRLSPPDSPGTAIVSGTSLNVRSSPNSQSKILATLPLGSVVQVLGKNKQWINIQLPRDVRGWVSKEFLTVPETKFLDFFTGQSRKVEVTAKIYDPVRNLNIPMGSILPIYQGTVTHEVLLPDTRRVILDPDSYQVINFPTVTPTPLFMIEGTPEAGKIRPGCSAVIMNTYANIQTSPVTGEPRAGQVLFGDEISVLKVQGTRCKVRINQDLVSEYWTGLEVLNTMFPRFKQAINAQQIAVCTNLAGIPLTKDLTIPFGARLPYLIDKEKIIIILPDGRSLVFSARPTSLFTFRALTAIEAIDYLKEWVGVPFKNNGNLFTGVDSFGLFNLFGRLTDRLLPANESAVRSTCAELPLQKSFPSSLKPGDALISITADPDKRRYSIYVGDNQILTCGMDFGVKLVELDAHELSKVIFVGRLKNLQ